MTSSGNGDIEAVYTRPHLRFGWWSLLLFLSLGIVLETLHGFKVGWLLDVENETRRLMWSLAHAHGTLIGLINVAFAATLAQDRATAWTSGRLTLTSRALFAATLFVPGGFLLGGIDASGGDPGLGILLVPPGGLLLLLAVVLIAREALRSNTETPSEPGEPS